MRYMNKFRISWICVGAVLLVFFAGGVTNRLAYAQQVQDCAVPSPLPRGAVSKSLSDCAIQHAQYLYAHRCVPGQACEKDLDRVIAAYRTAARLFDLYLSGLDALSIRIGHLIGRHCVKGFVGEI